MLFAFNRTLLETEHAQLALIGETGAQTNTGHVETWGFCIVAFEQE